MLTKISKPFFRLIFVTKLNVRHCSPWRKTERVSKYNDRVSFWKTRKGERRLLLGTMEKESERDRESHKCFEGKCISGSDWWTPQGFSHMALFMMSFIQLLYLNVSWNLHKSYWKYWSNKCELIYAMFWKVTLMILPTLTLWTNLVKSLIKSHRQRLVPIDKR